MNPSLFRRIRGPVFLLCFAVTAILSQQHVLTFAQSWPLYLLTAGLLRLLEAVLPAGLFQSAGYNAQFYAGAPLIRRASLTGAVAELVIGTIALLLTTDTLSLAVFWRTYANWWPLLLVLLGVLLLLERLFDGLWSRGASRRYGNAGVYAAPRRRGGGIAGLVVLLILLGLFSRETPFLSNNGWRWNPDWNWSYGGETHENDISLTEPIAADAALTIENAHGDLQIAPSTDGEIHVDAHQTAHVADRNKESEFEAAKPVLEVHGSSATVTVPGRKGMDVRLVLAVPDGVLCTIHNHHGDIAISGLKRALEITQDHGNVTLDSIGGPVHLVMDHGDISARALAGDLAVEGRANDISASDVKGRTLLHGEFFGDTQLDGLGGAVEFHTSRTQLDAQHVTGSVSLDSEDLRISGVDRGLKLDTRSKEVEITGLSGEAEINDSNSDVSVTTKLPLGALSIMDNTGDISLSVPSGAGFSINGQTGKDDDIESDFPLNQATDGGIKTLSGQVGQGGPHLVVKTQHGDLSLHRSSAGELAIPAIPAIPKVPAVPAVPSHLRHLQSPGEPAAPSVQ